MFHRPFRACASLAAVAALMGLSACSSVTTAHHRAGDVRSVCQPEAPAVVLWGAAWRDDQKSPGEREIMAERGMRQFFAKSGCFQKVDFVSSVNRRSPLALSDVDLLRWVRAQPTRYNTVLQVRLEELTPNVMVQPSLILWQGNTEVQLRVRVLDVDSMKLITDRDLRWLSGGPYVVKGTSSLDADMSAALNTILSTTQPVAPVPAPASASAPGSR